MTDLIVPTVMTVAIFVGIVAWVVVTRRPAIRMQRLVLVMGVGLATIGLWVAVRLALPESIRPVAVVLLGLALSGLLIGLAVVYRHRLPPGQMRHMILFGIVGAVLTVLGLVTD